MVWMEEGRPLLFLVSHQDGGGLTQGEAKTGSLGQCLSFSTRNWKIAEAALAFCKWDGWEMSGGAYGQSCYS